MTPVCRAEALLPERGGAALVDGAQVAVFRLPDGEVCAVDNHDPRSGANVLSRGLVGSVGDDTVYVASPLFKTRFDLRTGACLDDPESSVHVWSVDIVDGWVRVER